MNRVNRVNQSCKLVHNKHVGENTQQLHLNNHQTQLLTIIANDIWLKYAN